MMDIENVQLGVKINVHTVITTIKLIKVTSHGDLCVVRKLQSYPLSDAHCGHHTVPYFFRAHLRNYSAEPLMNTILSPPLTDPGDRSAPTTESYNRILEVTCCAVTSAVSVETVWAGITQGVNAKRRDH